MNLDEWLKNTIPGIVLLGAIGSVVAALLMRIVGRYVPPIARNTWHKFVAGLVRHFVAPATRQAIRLHQRNVPNKVQYFHTLQLMLFGFSLLISVCGFVAFLITVSTQTEPALNATLLISLMFFFLGIWTALRTFAIVAVPALFDVETEIEKATAELVPNTTHSRGES